MDAYNQCSIHERRWEYGYHACESFDCFGAGQWITQTLFADASWSDSLELATRMFAAYRRWLPRFEAAALLEAALPHVCDDARGLLCAGIDALLDKQTTEPPALSDGSRLRRETLALIHSLLAKS